MFVYANTGNFIHIGRAGENLATQVIFDISEYKKEWGDGEVKLLVEKDYNYYPAVCYKTGNKIYSLNVTTEIEPGHYYFVDEENTGTVILFEVVEPIPAGSTLRYEPTNQEKFFTITQTINGKESQLPCQRKFVGDIPDWEYVNPSEGDYATAKKAGIMKLYQNVGNNTDGTISQKVITDELDDKVELQLNNEEETIVFLIDAEDEVTEVEPYNSENISTSLEDSTNNNTKNTVLDNGLTKISEIYITENGTVLKEEELETNEITVFVYSRLEFTSETQLTGNLYVVWEITKADTQKPGIGKCSLTYYVNNIIKARSPIYSIIVTNALGDDQEEEPAEYNWVELILDKATYIETKIDDAIRSAKEAKIAEEEAEAWATGAVDGIPVDTEDRPQYNNSAKFWATMAQSLTKGDTGINVPGREYENKDNALYYYQLSKSWSSGETGIREDEAVNNSKYWSEQSENYSDISEAWAIGTKQGQPLEEDAPQKENHAKYWAEKAGKSASDAAESARVAAEKEKSATEAAQATSEDRAAVGQLKIDVTNLKNDTNKLVETAKSHAETAKSHAETAKSHADNAKTSADAAAQSEINIKNYVSKPPIPNEETGTWWVYDSENSTITEGELAGYINTKKIYDFRIDLVLEEGTSLETIQNPKEGMVVAVPNSIEGLEDPTTQISVYTNGVWRKLITLDGSIGTIGEGNMKMEDYDPGTNEVLKAGGIPEYVNKNTTKIIWKTWSTTDMT